MHSPDAPYWVALGNVRGVGPRLFLALLRRFGTPQSVFHASSADLEQLPRLSEEIAANIARATDDLQSAHQALERAARQQARLVTFLDDDYPQHLKSLADAPPYLYLIGDAACHQGLVLAVVGRREPSMYGLETTQALVRDLAQRGWSIASGMARGIDAAAHRAALDAGGRSVGVAGCGVGHLHADANAIDRRLGREGAVISEFPPDMGGRAGTFPRRNRIISGVALGTLVIEAGQQSGALITADFAKEGGRPLFAVPGRAGDESSRGANALIKGGARLVETADDILEVFEKEVARFKGSDTIVGKRGNDNPLAAPATPPTPATTDLSEFTEEEQSILRHLLRGPVEVDELLRTGTLTPARLATNLLKLEVAGVVRRLPGSRLTLQRPLT